ncbi:MAG: efflux RND transporter periplasmic adaptor subunit, partial [Chloroflexi bacterium]|nr:efflux RND transporter periplasmic adaptor subunit [Chloroflexota bacterium]
IYYGIRSLNSNGNGTLSASGTIETISVNISPELAGKIKEVLVEEGQTVKAGDPLLHLDDSLLTAQRAVAAAQADSAKAALATAQTNYDNVVQNALAAEQASTAKDLRFSAPDEFSQPAWYFSQSEEIAAAQAEVSAAKKALDDAQANLQKVISDLNNADFINAEKRLANARAAFLVADDVKTTTDNAVEGGGVQKAGDANYNAALDELRAAQNAYNALLNSKSATNVENARGQVIVAQQRYDTAYARLLSLQTGLQSPAVIAAGKTLDQAKAAVQQADANLALIDAQMAKLIVYAPMDGIILTRNVEPGEFVQPGATALTMANINELTITVYVPEDRIHEIKLGQQATVMIDAVTSTRPTFKAEVVHIADQAEFTPRNVQTVEG